MSGSGDPERRRDSAKRGRSPPPDADRRPGRSMKAGCFECGATDHLKRDCPKLRGGGAAGEKRAKTEFQHFGGDGGGDDDDDIEKEKVDYGLSGALNKEQATYKGIVLKWNEPADMHLPKDKWRLYVFKGDQQLKEPYTLGKVPAVMFGRERKVVDIPVDHPSCSNQHAVICFRLVDVKVRDDPIDGPVYRKKCRPYIIDLNTTNGTVVSGKKIEGSRYYQLMHQDLIQFGTSTREYVMMNMTQAQKEVESHLEDAGEAHLIEEKA